MARDATARLYDVDENSVVYKKPDKQGKYDLGTVTFQARQGKLIRLDQLHESVWATRLSGGTRSALVSLDVTVAGDIVATEDKHLRVVVATGEQFVLGEMKDDKSAQLEQLRKALSQGGKVASVTGRVEGWEGHWPAFLNKAPPKEPRLLVTSFEIAK